MDFDYWQEQFRRNSVNRKEPKWDAPMQLSGVKLRRLTQSLEQFQLGDGGGPGYLISWNRERYLGQSRQVRELVDLWFREEREHSRLLGDALKRFGGRPIASHWSFTVFCAVRRRFGIRFELSALLLTEIVSHVYYKMLYKHGGDVALRAMCRLIIRDEAGHLRFHRARLVSEATATGRRHYGRFWEMRFRLRGLLAGSMLWINHRKALVTLGGTTPQFYKGIWLGMSRFLTGVREDLERTRRVSRSREKYALRAAIE